jgi:hypothetical protein
MSSTEYHSVTLFESRTTIENGTTGLRTWRASFVLAQFLIQNPSMACVTNFFAVFTSYHLAVLVNKSVLELGSGTGFLGLIVADIQISHGGVTGRPILYLTDVNEDVLRQCSENTQLSCSRRSAWVVDLQLSYSQTHLTVTETCLSNRWTGLMHWDRTASLTSEHLWTVLNQIWCSAQIS